MMEQERAMEVMAEETGRMEAVESHPERLTQIRQRIRVHDGDLLTISDQERGFMPEDNDDVKWNYLAGAAHRHLVLTGVVSGIERLENGNPVCVIDYEGIRVLIPAREMFFMEWPEDEEPPRQLHIQLGRILGATIDFIPTGADLKNRAAVASRTAAMKQRQTRYYASGRIREGIRMTCRVVGVGNHYVTVEAAGVDSVIPAGRLSWEWFADVVNLYATGDLVVARVLSVHLNQESGLYSVELSVKAATDNPDIPTLRKLVPGSSYYGVVTGVKDRLIFVRLQAGANAKTMSYRTREIPGKLDTVSFQVKSIDEERGMAFGIITRIIRRHARFR